MRRLVPFAWFLLLPALAAGGERSVTAGDLSRHFGFAGLLAEIAPDDTRELPVISPEDASPEAGLLRRLVARGKSGGLSGAFYDNRDRGHSALPADLFPQLARITYGPTLRARNLDYGIAGRVFYPGATIGNSSTALTAGPRARSLPRAAMTFPGGAGRAWLTYARNHVYVYPEHRDYDEVDRFPANWPYMLASQGSSGSDRPFLRAVALIVAALPADTRAFAERKGLVAPTVQMVFRRAQSGVYRRTRYLSGAAHPPVFDRAAIDPTRMITLAASLRPGDLPPAAELAVIEEDFSDEAGLAGLPERLFDTRSAIARVWRSTAHSRRITLSAHPTKDPNGRDLRFDWVLLQGDPQRVTITPSADGLRAEIAIRWHDRRPVRPGIGRLTDRVDIGLFANNGVHDSAPAIFSVSFPTHQIRRYARAADGEVRIVSVDYDARGRGRSYDPVLHWSAPWRDSFTYGPDGSLESWRRETPHGVLELGPEGALADGRRISYRLEDLDGPAPRLTMQVSQ